MINNEIGYAGQVTVTAVHGKKKIKSATFHNKGTTNLFKFICYCLAGEYNVAYNLRPQKIQLFHNNGDAANNPSERLSELEPCSSKIQTNTDAVVKDDTTDNPKYTVTLHFRIPYAFITDTSKTINHAVLFNGYDEECAHFCFIENDQWQNLIEGINQDYTLVIEWKMIVSNQQGDN